MSACWAQDRLLDTKRGRPEYDGPCWIFRAGRPARLLAASLYAGWPVLLQHVYLLYRPGQYLGRHSTHGPGVWLVPNDPRHCPVLILLRLSGHPDFRRLAGGPLWRENSPWLGRIAVVLLYPGHAARGSDFTQRALSGQGWHGVGRRRGLSGDLQPLCALGTGPGAGPLGRAQRERRLPRYGGGPAADADHSGDLGLADGVLPVRRTGVCLVSLLVLACHRHAGNPPDHRSHRSRPYPGAYSPDSGQHNNSVATPAVQKRGLGDRD